jgi:hypothetical protein
LLSSFYGAAPKEISDHQQSWGNEELASFSIILALYCWFLKEFKLITINSNLQILTDTMTFYGSCWSQNFYGLV